MKLIVIDLDGTMLSDNGSVSKANKVAILDEQNKGNIIVVCTGRAHHDALAILSKSGIECPIISGNGAVLFYNNNFIRELTLPLKITTEIVTELEKKGLYYELYSNKGIFLLKKGRDYLENEIHRFRLPYNQLKEYIDNQYKQFGIIYFNNFKSISPQKYEFYKIFIFSFDSTSLSKIKKLLDNRKDISVNTYGSNKLEISHREVSKGDALKFLANYLKIPIRNTVAIGDYNNDISMFKVAGISIAMENSNQETKNYSNFVTKSNNEDGVAYALKKYVR